LIVSRIKNMSISCLLMMQVLFSWCLEIEGTYTKRHKYVWLEDINFSSYPSGSPCSKRYMDMSPLSSFLLSQDSNKTYLKHLIQRKNSKGFRAAASNKLDEQTSARRE